MADDPSEGKRREREKFARRDLIPLRMSELAASIILIPLDVGKWKVYWVNLKGKIASKDCEDLGRDERLSAGLTSVSAVRDKNILWRTFSGSTLGRPHAAGGRRVG